MSSLGKRVRNTEIGWSGGYPLVVSNCGTVHALKGAQASYEFLCGATAYDYIWTKRELNCQRCAKIIETEARSR